MRHNNAPFNITGITTPQQNKTTQRSTTMMYDSTTNDLLSIDEPLAVQKGGNTYYYHADGLGSITSLSNAAGVEQTYTYDSFGNITVSGSISQPYAFTSREYDYETGMYFYRARYYDPKVGRFVTKDPVGFAGGDVNLYNYVGANPVNWGDPSGLDIFRDKNEPYKVGRKDNPIVPEGEGLGKLLDDYFPFMHTMAVYHDDFDDLTKQIGPLVNDILNYPSMPFFYGAAAVDETLWIPFRIIESMFPSIFDFPSETCE